MKKYFLPNKATLVFLFGSLIVLNCSYSQSNVRVKVLDALSLQPVPLASISLSRIDSAFLKSRITDKGGVAVFSGSGVSEKGKYKLTVSHIGFSTSEILVSARALLDSTTIVKISRVSDTLQDVTVYSANRAISPIAGGYIYTAEKKAVGLNPSFLDLAKQFPGFSQSRDGNLTLMGETITFWMDGRPLNLKGEELKSFLRSLRSSDIKTVNIYSTPPAYYDASATVVEIITEKYFAKGIEYSFDQNVATGDKHYSGLSLKYNSKNYSGSLKLSYDHTSTHNEESFVQTNLNLPDSLYQYNNSSKIRRTTLNSLGITSNNDFATSAKSTVGVLVRFNTYDRLPYLNQSILTAYNSSGGLTNKQEFNRTNASNIGIFFSGISYRTILNKNGSTFSSDFSFWKRKSSYSYDQYTDIFRSSSLVMSSDDIRNNFTKNDVSIYMISTNLQHNISDKLIARFGAKLSVIENSSDFIERTSNDKLQYNIDPNNTYLLKYNESVAALFFNLNGRLNKLQYSTGIRFESTNTQISTTRILGKSNDKNNFSNLFPSLSLTYPVSKKLKASVGVSRSIIRIQYAQLNPLNLRRSAVISYQGNPYLKPILQNAGNLSLDYNISAKHAIGLMARYSESKNSFLPILYSDTSHPGQYIEKYTTYNGNTSIFVNAFYRGTLSKHFALNASVRTFNTWLRLNNISGYPDPPGHFTVGSNLGIIFSFWRNAALEIKGQYQTPQILVEGTGNASRFVDLGLSKSFIKDKLTITIGITDLFNSYETNTSSHYPLFYQVTHEKGETQIMTLSMSYRFGGERKNKIKSYSIQEERRFGN